MFKIKDKLFDIKYAYLDAFVNDNELIFGLQIKLLVKTSILKMKMLMLLTYFFKKMNCGSIQKYY